MKATKWEVKGMNCTGCASAVNNQLESLGMKDIFVDFSSGEVSFVNAPKIDEELIVKGIEKLGYTVIKDDEDPKKKDWILG
jgi:copper chaperone CopZ